MLSIDSILLKKERSDSTLLNLTRVKSNLKKFEKNNRIKTDTVQNEIKCDQLNKNDSMYKVLKLLKLEAKKNVIKRQRFKYIEDILIEWKEVASRLENIFFILSITTIIITPIVLFGKFIMRDFVYGKKIYPSCGCEY